MPKTQARAVPLRGSKVLKEVITWTNVSAVRSATVCGSALRRAKYAVTAAKLARYIRSNSAAASSPTRHCRGSGGGGGWRSGCPVLSLTHLVAIQPPWCHTFAREILPVWTLAQASLRILAGGEPSLSAGRSYVVTDRDFYTVRQRIEFIAHHLGVDVDLVDMPYGLASPSHAFYQQGPGHRATFGELIREELGYSDTFDTATGLAQTVDWLTSASEDEIDEVESQFGDRFDYDFEDVLIAWWEEVTASAPQHPDGPYKYSHIYRHPASPVKGGARRNSLGPEQQRSRVARPFETYQRPVGYGLAFGDDRCSNFHPPPDSDANLIDSKVRRGGEGSGRARDQFGASSPKK